MQLSSDDLDRVADFLKIARSALLDLACQVRRTMPDSFVAERFLVSADIAQDLLTRIEEDA